jgi:hemoglobin-like flavoprotein
MRGQIGKQIVVKQYGNKTVITAYPDMSHVKPSKQQKQQRKLFAAAIAYAQSIVHDPVRKEAYAKKLKKGVRVYNAAIREYLAEHL